MEPELLGLDRCEGAAAEGAPDRRCGGSGTFRVVLIAVAMPMALVMTMDVSLALGCVV